MSKRTERVADLIRREMMDILMRKMRDPRLSFISVTGVEVSGDLSSAKIWISGLSGKCFRWRLARPITGGSIGSCSVSTLASSNSTSWIA